MNLRRRMLWLALALLAGIGALLWSWRGTSLRLGREHAVVGRLLVGATRGSAASAEIAGAAGLLDDPARQASTRAGLAAALAKATGETLDFGFGLGEPSVEVGPETDRRLPLAAHAAALLRAQDNPLLLVHTTQPAQLAKVAARRGWIGPLAAEVFASARSISVAVSEDAEGGRLRVTLALEFAEGAAAEKALARLTAANGDYGQLGFVAQPGYERIVRRTHLVVIRLDAPTALAAGHLRGR